MSIPSNIAEGAARRSRAEYKRFVAIARGSRSELDTQVQIAERLEYATPSQAMLDLIERLFARLTALLNALERSEAPGPGFSDSPFPIADSLPSHAR